MTLWCAPDVTHRSFRDLGVALKRQPNGDLGARMLAAFHGAPTLIIGTDCPALTAAHLRDAARALETHDVVLIPAEDGGYVLIGARRAHAGLFTDMAWGVSTVLAETRQRIAALGLSATELSPLWDVDTEDDLARMERGLSGARALAAPSFRGAPKARTRNLELLHVLLFLHSGSRPSAASGMTIE